MPKDKRDPVSSKSEREQFLDVIFGPDEEVDENLADEILASHGITGSELVEEFKLRLQAELRSHYQETNEISKPLKTALKGIQEQQRASQPKPVQAHSWIEDLLTGNVSSNAPPQLLYSWHKQKEGVVSENDKRILDELEGEMKDSE
jgi:hypothetical protein